MIRHAFFASIAAFVVGVICNSQIALAQESTTIDPQEQASEAEAANPT